MNNKEFIWTDELAFEFAQKWVRDRKIFEWAVREFKASKTATTSDYEILLMGTPPYIHPQDNHCDELNCAIHSVKYLPTGINFTVGDEITKGRITGFQIVNDKMAVGTFTHGLIPLFAAQHVPKEERKPVFKTNGDNVDIFEGQTYCFVDTSNFTTGNFPATIQRKETAGYIYFSTESAANDYVLMNKPCLSVKEIMDFNPEIERNPNLFSPALKAAIELVKQRIAL